MFITKKLENGSYVDIIVRHSTEKRLKEKCFRGVNHALAGNFFLWTSADEVFQDPEVLEHFLAEITEILISGDYETHSVCITCSSTIGWKSTDELCKYASSDLETLILSHKSQGLRVKTTHTHILAPQTYDLTIVFELKDEKGKATVIVYSIYPGKDVGELTGDVTAREKRIFFDWNHPGTN